MNSNSNIPSAASWRLRSHVWAGSAVLLFALAAFVARAYMQSENDDLRIGSAFLVLIAAPFAAFRAWECRLAAQLEDIAERIGQPIPDVEGRLKSLGYDLQQAGFGTSVDLHANRIVVYRQSEWTIVRFFRRHSASSLSVSTNAGEQTFAMPNGERADAAAVIQFAKAHVAR